MDKYLKLKKKAFETLIETGLVMAIVDTTVPGARVPSGLQGEVIGLAFGIHLPIPIPDLRITEDGIAATLHFNRDGYVDCFLPWASVIGLRLAGTATMFQFNRDLGEVESQWAEAEADPEPEPEGEPCPRTDAAGRPRFTLIPGGMN